MCKKVTLPTAGKIGMAVFVIFLFSIIAASVASGESQDRWEKVLFGESNDAVGGYCVEQTSDGGYVLTGYYHKHWEAGGEFHLIEGACLIKTAEDGTFEWLKVFNASNDDTGQSVRQTSDGGYIITGCYTGDERDVWLIKTDASGNMEWNTTFGGDKNDIGYSVEQTTDGGYIVAGSTSSYGAGENIWLIKTNSSGIKEWDRVFGRGGYQNGRSVQQTTDGGYIIGGDWLVKTDSKGNEEWIKEIEGEDARQTADGGYIIAGSGYDIKLTKTDSEGNEEWSRKLAGSGKGTSVRQTTDGGYIIAGYGGGDGWIPCSMVLIKTDSEGNKEWDRIFGGDGEDRGFSVRQTTDGGYIMTGATNSYGGGGEDALLIKTDSKGYTRNDKITFISRTVSSLTNAVSYLLFIVIILIATLLYYLALPLLIILVLILIYMWRKRKSE
ncbi:hypothetical protein [Methanolobus vulcani]|uniref:Uncharacterized protein n=1 Tax=Methanolobus vulcani TaxID=38026 RepID=A0A7Z8P2Z7_9EURY|nr:hypothetical protein [Methanolobus vulcani]TQD26678.1 hypothetical protein FKV42_04275 [Methanolobus vulcani]